MSTNFTFLYKLCKMGIRITPSITNSYKQMLILIVSAVSMSVSALSLIADSFYSY